MNLDSIPISKSMDKFPRSDTIALMDEIAASDDEATHMDESHLHPQPMKSIPMTVTNLKQTLSKIHSILTNSQRRITCLSVLYLIIFCLLLNLIVISENVFFKREIVLDEKSILLNPETLKPYRSILYSYTALLLLNLGATVITGLLCGGVMVDHSHINIHISVSRIFVISVCIFLVLMTGELIMYGLLAGQRMLLHYKIPIVIMCLIETCMIILAVASIIVIIRHWKIAKIYRRYASLNLAQRRESFIHHQHHQHYHDDDDHNSKEDDDHWNMNNNNHKR